MASRIKQGKPSQSSSSQVIKKDKLNQMQAHAKRPTKMKDQSSDDDDDDYDDDEEALEMEQNFALLSKRSSMQTLLEDEEGHSEEEMREEDGSAEDDEAPEQHDDNDAVDDEEDSGSEEDLSESGSDQEEAVNGGSKDKSHTEDIKKELSTMSFEEIMMLQNKVGTKAYNKIAYGAKRQQQQNNEPMKRLSKHKPQEISAKKHVPFLRKVIPVKKMISRDPRFDDLSGEYKPEIFNQTYKFINNLREEETQIVRKKLKKAKSESKKEELKALLKRLENQQRSRQRQEHEREKELQFKRKQRELVGQGHKPFYLKKSDKKKLELADKYSELKKSGKLENFLSKKRKRNSTKDRKKLPNQHKAR